ncbi:MAG: DUF4290 domain-containing protein [Chitinophagaceae bacterium]|nr:DUF4290 domain-containing protein [Chitinophagaceae bacterium]
MEYNTTREIMPIREYGRNVQNMINQLLQEEDKEKRQKNAEAVIEIMAILNPDMKSVEDIKQKLWDHLFMMAGYELDVESPYPKPTPESKAKKPEVLAYPKNKIKWNHFGKKFEAIYDKAILESDEEKKKGFVQVLGLFMKIAYQNWHKENMHDDMIKDELLSMSKGQLEYIPGQFAEFVDGGDAPPIFHASFNNEQKSGMKKKNNNNNNNRNNKFKKNFKRNNIG